MDHTEVDLDLNLGFALDDTAFSSESPLVRVVADTQLYEHTSRPSGSAK